MALRLVEVMLPQTHENVIDQLLADEGRKGAWQMEVDGERLLTRILVRAEEAEALLDRIERDLSDAPGYRVMLIPVEAALPRVLAPAEKTGAEAKRLARVSRAELWGQIEDAARISRTFLALVVLSTIVAAIGLLRDNAAVIIGAMVLAPLLGPNVGLALGTTLADRSLSRLSLGAAGAGIGLAFALSFLLGLVVAVDPSMPEIAARTHVALSDVALALVAGTAGALAFTTGASSALIGVMVAVALLPPTVTAGVLLGAGEVRLSLGALLLVGVNVISVNLAGVATFLVKGVRPRAWWEADRARHASRTALAVWSTLLAVLVVLVVVSQTD